MRISLIVFCFIFLESTSRACDICGCSSGNYFIGPTPQFSRLFVGQRYSFRTFNTVLKENKDQFSKDFYQTFDLWLGYTINKKLQLLAFIPYNLNFSLTDDGDRRNYGLGDATFIGNYNIFESKYATKKYKSVSHLLWIGCGIKLPTGRYQLDTTEMVSSANIQSGTGSLDFLFNTNYSFVYEILGISANANYKINQSSEGFRYGNRFTSSTFLFYSFDLSSVKVRPNLGILYENFGSNFINNERILQTGGESLLTSGGLEIQKNKISTGFNFQLPTYQNISSGQTKIVLRGMFHLTYVF